MPFDFDMLLSASPPNFGVGVGHYFPGSVNNFKASMKMYDHPVVGKGHLHLNANGIKYGRHSYKHVEESPKPGPSILVVRSMTQPFLDTDINGMELSKSKSDGLLGKAKHVCFADDCGLALAHVKFMQEPSEYPPLIREDVLASIAARGACAKAEPDNIWEINFAQPASDYLKFRETVDKSNVSLENVVLKDYQILGTVKVKNLAFDKRVFIRITFNNWLASVDVPATYVPSGVGGSSAYFDTFSFEITIPPETNTLHILEFCVCYQTDHKEFWDNCNGANYKLVPVKQVEEETPTLTLEPEQNGEEDTTTSPYFQAYYETDDFGEFASWKDIDDSLPYW